MAVEVVFAPNPIYARDPGLARAFEDVVAEAVSLYDGAASGPLHVRFQVWEGDEPPLYLCKVESPATRALDEQEQWRWWSPLVGSPDELDEELSEALRLRQLRLRAGAPAPESAASPSPVAAVAERWGWGAEVAR